MDIQSETDVAALLRQWEEEQATPSYDPVPLLTRYEFIYNHVALCVFIILMDGLNYAVYWFHRLCELVEAETENYLKGDPDPFDERHPSRADPNCAFGQMLKMLFRKDTFMNKVTVCCISVQFIPHCLLLTPIIIVIFSLLMITSVKVMDQEVQEQEL